MCIYLSVPVFAIWLYPSLVREVYAYFFVVVIAYLVSILSSLIRFKAIASYLTWGAKLAAVVMSAATLLVFVFGLVWPFKIAVILQVLVSLEEVLITFKLESLRSNVKETVIKSV